MAQRRAADPRASAWVSANAGAGKTKVLSDRVLRLLLAGAPPGRILCLTFTKAAAANMAIRIFERLGKWVTLEEAKLADELTELKGAHPSADHVREARRLFARAVETPGGLKIETIHAFCERLLHLVPFEANVPARFSVLDEAEVGEMTAEAMRAVLAEAAREESREIAAAFSCISLNAGGRDGLTEVIAAAVKAIQCGKLLGGLDACMARLRATLGLLPHETAAEIERAMVEDGLAPAEWPRIADVLDAGKANDRKRAAALRAAIATQGRARLDRYRCVFFTEKDEPRADNGLVTQAIGDGLKQRLIAERDRIAGLCRKLKAAETAERTESLYRLAAAVVRRVEAEKQRRGALDFDDLIERTLALFSRGDGAWVLYRLDRGIDHVLVDEAQDTNPDQWAILRHLTEDFWAGRGARGRALRTLFAVGDPKQSIYGFQGAAPKEFEESRTFWRKRTLSAELRFEDVRLTLSFRSAKAVLSAVDETFGRPAHFKGLSFEDGAIGTTHESARPHAPGLVELWPTEEPQPETEPDAWTLPVDEPERHAPPIVLAARIAKAIKAWTTTGDESGRVWRAGDILVLVRKRGAAFEAVIRALKGAGVPVAGADRIDVGAHIAVLDLIAAGRAALLPQDDLTLAAALKSSLVGFSDDDLIRIAAGRDDAVSLAEALDRAAAAGDAAAERGRAALAAWRGLAQRHGPFGFFASLLGPMEGRKKLVARLGTEAGDAIDAFLCFAHTAEMAETPALATFLTRFESASHEVKRDLEGGQDEVRVMTVHGAKGLEAPVVIVIDGCDVLGQDPQLVPVRLAGTNAELPVWSPGQKYDPPAVAEARAAMHARGREEHNRLLYVAMTRAKDRLVIAPYRGRRDAPEEAWCEMVRRSLTKEAGGLVIEEAPYGPVERWRDGNPWPQPAAVAGPVPAAAPDLPAWLTTPVPPEPEPPPRLAPSQAAPRRRGGATASEARLRGILVHTLLERLPAVLPERRQVAAEAYVRARAPRLGGTERAVVVANAMRVLGHEELRALFGPGSRAEAAIAGRLVVGGTDRPVAGRIDRLAVLADEVLLADFKSDTRVPTPGEPAPAPYALQLALYRRLLQEIYPGRRVRSFLVWTAGPYIQELPSADLDRALDLLTAA
ncbi:MAG TPA: double-strand break repair helicase AddA [Beijerinckiaceae bacterium]